MKTTTLPENVGSHLKIDGWKLEDEMSIENKALFSGGVNFQGPIGSMYGIFTYICLFLMVNVGEYTMHGSYGGGFFRCELGMC